MMIETGFSLRMLPQDRLKLKNAAHAILENVGLRPDWNADGKRIPIHPLGSGKTASHFHNCPNCDKEISGTGKSFCRPCTIEAVKARKFAL